MPEEQGHLILTAEVVYQGIGAGISDGAVVLDRQDGVSRIIDVSSREDALRIWRGAEVRDAGFAISPAPVNAHTHLDLTDMPLVDDTYERFIPTVIAFAASGARNLAAAGRGAEEVLASGVQHVGDIVTRPEVMRWLLAHPQLAGVAYWEVIGMDPAQAGTQLAETEELIREFVALQRPGGVRVGLSPHTPQTVCDPLMQGLVQLARQYGLPLQIHVEESPLEKPMFLRGEGELAEVRRRIDPAWQPPGVSPLRHLEALGVLAAAPTLVHMVNATADEIRLVHANACRVVHCPRSNEQLRCGTFPWELYARIGVAVGIGTDARASSPSLAVQEEVRFAARLHGRSASAAALVRAAVKGGHQVLGLQPPRFVPGDTAAALHIWDAPAAAAA